MNPSLRIWKKHSHITSNGWATSSNSWDTSLLPHPEPHYLIPLSDIRTSFPDNSLQFTQIQASSAVSIQLWASMILIPTLKAKTSENQLQDLPAAASQKAVCENADNTSWAKISESYLKARIYLLASLCSKEGLQTFIYPEHKLSIWLWLAPSLSDSHLSNSLCQALTLSHRTLSWRRNHQKKASIYAHKRHIFRLGSMLQDLEPAQKHLLTLIKPSEYMLPRHSDMPHWTHTLSLTSNLKEIHSYDFKWLRYIFITSSLPHPELGSASQASLPHPAIWYSDFFA